jgi:hypothetical protein
LRKAPSEIAGSQYGCAPNSARINAQTPRLRFKHHKGCTDTGLEMSKNVEQNRLVIHLAIECLRNSGFQNVNSNRPQGVFPDVYVTAECDGIPYFIGITGREEIGADGKPNPAFNLVSSAAGLRKARLMAQNMNRKPAFVAIALRKQESVYSAYFGELEQIGSPRAIPMLSQARSKYRLLANSLRDPRLASLRD